jgi:hypothetical protein
MERKEGSGVRVQNWIGFRFGTTKQEVAQAASLSELTNTLAACNTLAVRDLLIFRP